MPVLIFVKNQLRKYKKRRISSKEAGKIRQVCCSKKIREVIIVHDFSVSPPTYGDFFYNTMLARYFLMFEKMVHFWIINSEFRQDALEAYSKEEMEWFVRDILEIPQLLLNLNETSQRDIKLYLWPEAFALLNHYRKKDCIFIPFEKEVLNRNAFYIHTFNVINNLFMKNPKPDTDRYLIKHEELLPYINVKTPAYPYITWQVRYSEKWGMDRNTTLDDFLKIYESLRKFFPDHEIMIISDKIGCRHFKEISQERGINLLFSKDFSNSFMGDVALILKSKYFFALNGGGIGSTPVFSTIPYGLIAKPVHEIPFKKNKFASWSTENQIFINDTKGSPDKFFYKT